MGISSFGIKIPDALKVYGKEMGLSLMVSLLIRNGPTLKLMSSNGTTSYFTDSSRIGY
jgi:hypothetical protein